MSCASSDQAHKETKPSSLDAIKQKAFIGPAAHAPVSTGSELAPTGRSSPVEEIMIDPIDDATTVAMVDANPSAPVAGSSNEGASSGVGQEGDGGEEEEVVENERVVPVVDGVADAEILDSANSRLGFEYEMNTPLWYHWTMWAVPALLGACLQLTAMGLYGSHEPCFSYINFSTFQRNAALSPWWSFRGFAQHSVRGHFLTYALRSFTNRWVLAFYRYVAWNGVFACSLGKDLHFDSRVRFMWAIPDRFSCVVVVLPSKSRYVRWKTNRESSARRERETDKLPF